MIFKKEKKNHQREFAKEKTTASLHSQIVHWYYLKWHNENKKNKKMTSSCMKNTNM